MGITRDISRPVVSFVGTFHTNSTWSPATTGSTGHIVESATTYTGQVIDRLELGANFQTVDLCLNLHSTWGSTGLTNMYKFTLVQDLQGSASSSGTFAAITPPITYPDPVYFTTVDTTAMRKYSTGILYPGAYDVRTYDLNGQPRFIRSRFSITRQVTSTCTDKVEGAWVVNQLVFRNADELPPDALLAFSTSTSTST